MASAAHDYQRFMQWLHHPEGHVSDDARRFGRLVLENFESVSATSRNRSQRSVHLVDLARRQFAALDAAPPVLDALAGGPGWRWQKLTQLTLGPFRGFRHAEAFDLTKRIVLFYGPNGSGKTSLCEALEFALLGAVDEGAQKRIDAAQYLRNVHENRFVPPQLAALDPQGQAVAVQADADAYRFCFIEKNRIDSFSRIAAKPAGQKTELIAALFGMDDFNEFVGQFNESLDAQLNLVAVKGAQLEAKRQAIAHDVQLIANEPATVAAFAQAEGNYAAAFRPGLTYAQLQQEVGTLEAPGRLQALDDILNQPAPALYGIRHQDLLAAYRAADEAHDLVLDLTNQLAEQRDEATYQELYVAVQGLQGASPDQCPACGTPLEGQVHVHENPYTKAAQGLERLQALTELKQRYQAAIGQRRIASDALRAYFANFAQRVAATINSEYEVCRYIANPGVQLDTAWWKVGYTPVADGVSLSQQAVNYALQLEQLDVAIQQNLDQRAQLIEERDRLNQARVAIAEHAARRHQAGIAVGDAKQRVAAFEAENAELIREATAEGERIAAEVRVQRAYTEFLMLLRQYRAGLPGALMAGLNNMAMDLYNEFNVRDAEQDKLCGLHLPVTGEGRIELNFRGAPDRRVDALQVLSEGHVRCLGLAILLAKASSIQAPTIIFDDAINAIDHEHRQGIREALFESERFANTQIIVTCHSNEFIKDVQNHVDRNQWHSYTFLHHLGNHHPRVLRDVPPQAYLVNARAALERGDHRGALQPSRQALEMLANKIWRWLGKCELGMISVKVAGVGDQPSLRNLCDGLRARLHGAHTFNHDDKQPLLDAFGQLLGIGEQTFMWQYLNKGTHEEQDREDFDGGEVERLVALMEGMNALRLRNR
ncbi:AAA family ATPase [Stenotrophomonas maltophilia]|uniref:AAA family ATPase n=1 Tax=Stenotrophomonas maltophilia TaxID=40324 RepID=UPI0018D35108|nr:AAA family ATPase [Stenotrophomonas maltophilia]EMB2829839.1 AAA family ATPase [Stenotrophomonas maltophilia]MBH1450963.1 AAA family ATPase [Stenotrophomonas maltophilia]MBH1566225.1 AAA family ATPase [Stenotrophomonas maltophilia]MBH1727782.1 AAA family ATPase [Stenotrophomonas maltophilia]MBN5189134.1 AAA family ATPase [Stenotrophomonas maltophilia]